jgi:uncharacterized protein YggE
VTRFRLRALAFALSLAAGTLAACSSPAPQIVVRTDKDPVHPGQLVVTGSATLNVSPDCADLTMTITGSSMRPHTAVDEVRTREQALVVALKKLGVEQADLKLSTIGIQPEYEWIQSRSVLKTYNAQITISVTTKKFELLGELMEAGADAGVTQMASEFRRSDLATLKQKVRDQALEAAKEKARRTAATLGIPLGHVSSVAEQNPTPDVNRSYYMRATNAQENMDAAGAIGAELQPLTLEVTVTYDLPESA